MANPFRLGLEDSLTVGPSVIVIFGATGDLTHRKLVPALYNLAVDGLLPAHFYLVGAARREITHDAFRGELKDSVGKFSRRTPLDASLWKEFAANSFYVSVPFDEAEGYRALSKLLDEIDTKAGVQCNRVFYFATGPDYFRVIAGQLRQAGLLAREQLSSFPAVIVEKPFGHDLDSARVLNNSLLDSMAEDQIFRIDHYLGKETVQNILVFRFANGIFEPIWNHKYIDHVEISVCESIGVGNRAGYFDKSGILRDIVQNHALQLLCLVGLEPPVAFGANAVRDEKVKVLRSVKRFTTDDIRRNTVRGRYGRGSVGGEMVKGYLEESGVDPYSMTETYVAMQLFIDNWRWANVPFYIRAGKRLAKRVTEISIHFRNVPHKLFEGKGAHSIRPNILSFQIQPDEGIALKISSKPPGPKVRVQSVNMDFSYGASFGVEAPEAYERLLLDAMRGDATLFTRDDEIEQAWDVMDPVLDAWASGDGSIAMHDYESGGWGPEAADELLIRSVGTPWRRL